MSQIEKVEKVESPLIEWLKVKLIGKQIPFTLFSFVPAKENDWSEFTIEEVAGLKIPVLKDLTQSERIIIDTIENNGLLATLKLQSIIRDLSRQLSLVWNELLTEINEKLDKEGEAIALGEKSKSATKELTEKRTLLTGLKDKKEFQLSTYIFPSDSEEYRMVALTDTYQSFQYAQEEKINQIYTISQDMENRSFTDLIKVGFFLASRIGSEWLDGIKLNRLTEKQVKAINAFILREANGGEEPQKSEPTENKEPELGK